MAVEGDLEGFVWGEGRGGGLAGGEGVVCFCLLALMGGVWFEG